MGSFINEKICFYSSMFEGRSCMREIIECAHSFGVHGVEMMNFCDELRTPDRAAARELAALARGYGLSLPVFSAGIKLTEEVGAANREKLCRYVEICSELEIPILHHTIHPALNPEMQPKGEKFEAIFAEGVEAALEINEFAKRYGIRTVVEDQGLVFNGYENYNRFFKETEGKVGALLDVGNIFFADGNPCDLLEGLAVEPVHVHIKDYGYREESIGGETVFRSPAGRGFGASRIGTGDVDLARLAKGLKARGYDGLYSIEFERVQDMNEVAEVLKLLEDTFA